MDGVDIGPAEIECEGIVHSEGGEDVLQVTQVLGGNGVGVMLERREGKVEPVVSVVEA